MPPGLAAPARGAPRLSERRECSRRRRAEPASDGEGDAVTDDDVRGPGVNPRLFLELGEQPLTDSTIIAAASVVSWLRAAASARIKFARLMMPTSLPSLRTGTRLILFVSSKVAISARSVVSVTETTSGVITSLAVRPC